MLGHSIPAIALRREVQVAAVEAERAGLDQFLGGLALEVLVAERRDASEEFVGRLAALLPLGVQLLVHPWRCRAAGLRVVADDHVVARVRDRAALVIPDEGVVALDRVGNRRVALLGRHQAIGELADVVVVEGQCDVATDLAIADDRHGPAHDAAETLANRILGAGIGRLLRLERLARLFQRSRQVGADELGRDIGADDVGNVDLAGFQLFQLGEIAFCPDESVAPVDDVFQAFFSQVAARDLDLFLAIETDIGHFDEQRALFRFAKILWRPGMKILGVVRQDGAGDLGFTHRCLFRHPGFAVFCQLPWTVVVQGPCTLGQEVPEGRFRRLKPGSKADVVIAVVEEGGDFLCRIGGQRLDRFARAQVKGADGVIGDGFADRLDAVEHRIRHAASLGRNFFAQLLRGMPGKPGQQNQRNNLDDDKDCDQLATDAGKKSW